MSSPTSLQKRKRLDAHEDPEGSARGQSRRQGGCEPGRASGDSPDALVCAASSSTIPHGGAYGLEFATESWTGRKPTNEDRSAYCASEMSPLGPTFALYDGHGGTFTADFLVGKLLKAVAASVRQHIGERALKQLDASVALSRSERSRLTGISKQMSFVTDQLEQVAQLVNKPTSTENDDGEQDDEARALHGELEGMLRDLAAEARRIEEEELQRVEYRYRWFGAQDASIQRAFVDAFKHTDELILRKNSSRDGSTALVLSFFGDQASGSLGSESTLQQGGYIDFRPTGFYALNLGDCRAVLYRRGGAVVRLTSDHKPNRPDERARIEKAGGFVGTFAGIARVFSAAGAGLAVQAELATFLAVSRAFGDRSLKAPSALVSCEPEIERFDLDPSDLFLLVACDGVWDVLSDEDATSIVHQHLQDPKAAASAVIRSAFAKGSADNLTATVVMLRGSCEAAVTQAGKVAESDAKANPADREGDAQRSRGSIGRGVNSDDATANDSRESVDVEADEEIDMFNL